MMLSYIPIILMLAVGIVLGVVLLKLHQWLGPHRPNDEKTSTSQRADGWSRQYSSRRWLGRSRSPALRKCGHDLGATPLRMRLASSPSVTSAHVMRTDSSIDQWPLTHVSNVPASARWPSALVMKSHSCPSDTFPPRSTSLSICPT